MSNTVRNGFSTLNRLLGKKGKNPLSKSATNLNKLSTALDSSSQHNQIVPSAASSNAPFEQTFRITICLPLEQLYVVRVGAKTKLSTLLDMVCSNKLLDKDKFEFTHPVKIDQVYDLELTIGEVGLNELRLAQKTSPNGDEHNGIKYRYNTSSVISHQQEPRFTARPQSMFITKSSPSPYSSTNSLNSTDSSGINLSLRSNGSNAPVAPSRKKRVAPRPPSQNSIPENGEHPNMATKQDDDVVFKRPLDRKNFHVSSPNLSNGGTLNGGLKFKDFHESNGHIYTINEPSGDNSLSGSDITNSSDGGIGKSIMLSRPMSLHCDMHYSQNEQYERTDENGNRFGFMENGNHSRTSSEASESTRDGGFPEPTPRKKVVVAKKKAPAPPPRSASTILHPPVATPRCTTPKIDENSVVKQHKVLSKEPNEITPKPSPLKPRSTSNITKVMLNVENLQINIPDESINGVQTENEELIPNKHADPDINENIFHQKIIHNETQTQNGSSNRQVKVKYESSKVDLNGPDVKHNENENIDDITSNIIKKNARNLKESKEVRFNCEKNGVIKSPNDIDHEELSKEITDIIEKAVEIHSSFENNKHEKVDKPSNIHSDEYALQVKEELSKEINNIIKKAVEVNSTAINGQGVSNAPDSPTWTYPLPTANNFSDTNGHIADLSSEENFDGRRIELITSSPYKNNARSDDYTEIPIQPIIKKKHQVDFHEYSDSSLPTSNTTDTLTSSSVDQESLITSDIEDGYQGNDKKSMLTRELIEQQDFQSKRDQFIENEFGFLAEHDEKREGSVKPIVVNGKSDALKSSNATASIETNGFGPKPTLSSPTKTDVIDELNNIINTNRLDSVIKKSEENDDIDAAKRSSLSNFQIRSYTKSISEIQSKPIASDDTPPSKAIAVNKKRHSYAEDKSGFVYEELNDIQPKSREFTPVKRNTPTQSNGHTSHYLKSPRVINRSDSFHSTASMHQSSLQPFFNGEHSEPLSLTPRSSSYISLIGTQRYENKANKHVSQFNNEFSEATRRKSSSELSIADSPSLQSLSVMKSILSNSRKNSLNNLNNELKVNSNGDRFIEGHQINENADVATADDVDKVYVDEDRKPAKELISERSKSPEKIDDHQIDSATDEGEVVTTSISQIKASFETKNSVDEPKKWKYQGPPAISLSTWGERPKSQVVIKSDNDYKFGGIINNKKTLLQNRFSTSAIYDQPPEVAAKPKAMPPKVSQPLHRMFSVPPPKTEKPSVILNRTDESVAEQPVTNCKGHDSVDAAIEPKNEFAQQYERITPLPPVERPEELYKLPIVRGVEYKKNITIDEDFIKNDPIMRSQPIEDERVVLRSRSNYEVSRIMNERPLSVITNGPSSGQFEQSHSTMTLGRVPIPNKFLSHRQTINFAPQPFVSISHNVNRNSSFTPVVKGFKNQGNVENGPVPAVQSVRPQPTQKSPPVVKFGTYENDHYRSVSVEKPVFTQFALRKTGLKEKILDEQENVDQSISHAIQTKAKNPPPAPVPPKSTVASRQSTELKLNSFTPDPRHQLLDSIRSFSKHDLRKA